MKNVVSAATTPRPEPAPSELDARTPEGAPRSSVRSGTPELDAIYLAHARFVWRVLRGMGIGETHVPDAVQDVFIVVHRRYAEFDHRHKLRTWLFEIAFRVAHEYRRKHARAAALVPLDDDVLPCPDQSPVEVAEQSDRLRLVHKLLDQLSEDKRLVLVLSDLEGMTAPEVAELTRTPLNTVYTRLRRARAEFSECLAQHQRSQK